MRILVSEYLCSGAWPHSEFPQGWLREGAAMLLSLVEDLTESPDQEVFITWDQRLPCPDKLRHRRVHVWPVASSAEEPDLLRSALSRVDAALMIAPESAGVLSRRCRQVQESPALSWNCSPASIDLCADKWLLYERCLQRAIPTVPTSLPERDPPLLPCVVKRRDGAGSLDMLLIENRQRWQQWREEIDPGQWIVQPFVRGTPCSVAAICDRGTLKQLWPVARQRLSVDGRFHYLGGEIPFVGIDQHAVRQLIESAIAAIPGLHGYVGFDFIQAEPQGDLILVEVNPRMCTSYVGYRQIAEGNLTTAFTSRDADQTPGFSGSVRFTADGTILE